MNTTEIPLSANNQKFSITILGTQYQMQVNWRGAFWTLDISDSTSAPLVFGIPLITGADLLAQYQYLGFGFSLVVICDVSGQENPTEFDLGIQSHLLIVTE